MESKIKRKAGQGGKSEKRHKSSAIKRLFDFVYALSALILLSPLMLIVGIAIRIESRGPAFLKQQRVGQHGRLFSVLKFRTMFMEMPDSRSHQIFIGKIIRHEIGPERGAPIVKLGLDPRITRVGKFLRRTAIDEFPQFINILKGDMSIVGPRPVIPSEAATYKDWQLERFDCKPGLAGLWQASGRSEGVSYEQMLSMDVEYARNRSIAMDLKVLLGTISNILRGRMTI